MKKLYLILLVSFAIPTNAQNNSEIFAEEELQPGWIKVYRSEFVGIIDESGVEIVSTEYDEIQKFGTHKKDWAIISIDGLYGFIDDQGNVVVQPVYEQINKFGEFNYDWALVKKDGFFGFIDEYGNEVVTPTYDRIDQIKKTAKHNN